MDPTALHKMNLRYEVGRTFLLAAPLIVGQLTNFGMNFVDTVMAGRLGAEDLGAIAIGSAIWGAGFMFSLGVLMSVSPFVAQFDGAGEHRAAGSVTRQALWLALVLGCLMWLGMRNAGLVMELLDLDESVAALASGYIKAISWGAPALTGMLVLRFFSEGTGKTRPTMYIGVAGILLNIPLNYTLMFGKLGMPALGAVGCGWATAIVLWVQLFMMVVYILGKPHYRPFEVFRRFSAPRFQEIGSLLRVGLPVGVMIFLEGSLFVAAALLIGTLGALPVAAHQVAINFAGLMFMIPVGLSGAITVRVGNAIGRRDPEAARRAGLVGMGMALCIQSVVALVILSFPTAIARMYTTDPDVIELAAGLLLFAAIFQLPDALQAATAGALRGMKDTRIPLIFTVIAYWLVGMSLGWWLTFRQDMGPAGMWIGLIAGLTVAAVLLGGRYWRISRPGRVLKIA